MKIQPVTERRYQAITNGKVRVVLYDDGEVVVIPADTFPGPVECGVEYGEPTTLVEKP